jgi:hypothetical protein
MASRQMSATLVDKLQTSWMAKFLPTTTDTSKYDTLMKDILSGTSDSVVTATLDVLAANMQNDLTGVKAMHLQMCKRRSLPCTPRYCQHQWHSAQARCGRGARAGQHGNIVFARGRDQVAREATRQEAQVLADWAANGWSMPGGVLAAHQAAARQNTLDAASKIAAEEAVRTQTMNVDFAKMRHRCVAAYG